MSPKNRTLLLFAFFAVFSMFETLPEEAPSSQPEVATATTGDKKGKKKDDDREEDVKPSKRLFAPS